MDGTDWLDVLILSASLAIFLILKRYYNKEFILLAGVLALWLYYYAKNNFISFEQLMTTRGEVIYIQGYTWGIFHVIVSRSVPNAALKLLY